PLDPTLCTNPDSPGEYCSSSFDHKTAPGLCARCYIATKDAARAELMKDWPQCKGCSAQFKLLKAPLCGTCVKKDQQSAAPPLRNPLGAQDQNCPPRTDPLTRSLQEIQAETCCNAMVARTLQKGVQKPTTGSPSLQAAVAKGAPRQITVYLVPMTSNGTRTDTSRILANATRTFPEDIPMNDALAHLLRHWNLDWEKDCSESLAPEHISLCLLGNIRIQPHSTLRTLGHFFDTHDYVHGNHPKKILQGPTTLKLPSPAIYIEGFISVKDFEDKTGALAPYFVHTEKENRKRKISQTTRTLQSESKRTRSENSGLLPLRSEIGDLPGFSKIAFLFASVSVANDGLVSIEWLDLKDHENLSPSMCLLQDAPFDQGRTKKVYKAVYNGFPWVAKHFSDIGAGEGHVEIQENREQLIKEATRLGRTSYLLMQFMAEAKRKGVDIDQGISVTDFKLGIEVVENGSAPSPAPGISLEKYQAAYEVQDDSSSDTGIVIWLFEPRRSSKVIHWSGTNEYPAWHQNKLGSTLNTFAHYVYLFSQESTVLADLQTATAVNENGDGIQVLFDMMAHTTDGSSGVDDHGQTGIETFLKKHECVNCSANLCLSCKGFALASDRVPDDSDEED
ncbi:kinase-like domain-containing protein, partial [Mycena sp. CBHHK59/15]